MYMYMYMFFVLLRRLPTIIASELFDTNAGQRLPPLAAHARDAVQQSSDDFQVAKVGTRLQRTSGKIRSSFCIDNHFSNGLL